MSEAVRRLVAALAVGITKTRLYRLGHGSLARHAEAVRAALQALGAGDVEIMVVSGELVVKNALFRDAGLHGGKLVRLLARKGLSRVDLLAGVSAEELGRFLADVADPDRELGTYRRIRAGTAQVRSSVRGFLSQLDLADFNREQVERLRSVYATISPFRELETAGLEEIVANFLLTLRRGAAVLRMVSPVKTHSEYTYTHAMNVAVLSMSLAEHLRLPDTVVQDIGIAALMHDVGKLFVPGELLHKPGVLTPAQLGQIRRHPCLGAAHLAVIEGLTPLAAVVALEHHRRFDLAGYPVAPASPRRQHFASQLVAIADFFDALRNHRPYRRGLAVKDVLHLMQTGSGREFNPHLLAAFVVMLVKGG